MADKNVIKKRKKPTFIRRDWYKRKRLGKKIKKLRNWRRAYGRQNKVRTKEKGYAKKPGIGYRENKEIRGKINGINFERVENLKDLENLKGTTILIGKVGLKKRNEILKIAKERKLNVLNKYGERKKVEELKKKDVGKDKKEMKSEKEIKTEKKMGEKNATK